MKKFPTESAVGLEWKWNFSSSLFCEQNSFSFHLRLCSSASLFWDFFKHILMAQVHRGGIIIATFYFTIFDITNLPTKQTAAETNLSVPIFASHNKHHTKPKLPHRHHQHRFHFYITRKNVSLKSARKPKTRKKEQKFHHHSWYFLLSAQSFP